jgi:nucleoside-diphosphate-sugar epimerase
LKISEGLLHWGSDKQGGGCDMVHGAENSKHLLELPGASDRLKLFVAELMEPGCFDNVVEGCDGVFHTASPVLFKDITDPQAEVIDPAVNGTLNVLASCAKAQTKKVVLTSSIAAIIFTNKRNSMGGIDESLWSDLDFCRENKVLWSSHFASYIFLVLKSFKVF